MSQASWQEVQPYHTLPGLSDAPHTYKTSNVWTVAPGSMADLLM